MSAIVSRKFVFLIILILIIELAIISNPFGITLYEDGSFDGCIPFYSCFIGNTPIINLPLGTL